MLAEVAERDRGHMGFMLQPWHLIVIWGHSVSFILHDRQAVEEALVLERIDLATHFSDTTRPTHRPRESRILDLEAFRPLDEAL